MTSTEKQELLSMLSQQEADLQTKLQMTQDERRALEATPVTTPVWEPELHGDYWDSSVERELKCCDIDTDPYLIEAGLAHPTKEAAKRHHSFLVMLHDLHKFATENNQGWNPKFDNVCVQAAITYSHSSERLDTVKHGYMQPSILPYFKTQKLAQKAIDTFGDRLKILFEYYNS